MLLYCRFNELKRPIAYQGQTPKCEVMRKENKSESVFPYLEHLQPCLGRVRDHGFPYCFSCCLLDGRRCQNLQWSSDETKLQRYEAYLFYIYGQN